VWKLNPKNHPHDWASRDKSWGGRFFTSGKRDGGGRGGQQPRRGFWFVLALGGTGGFDCCLIWASFFPRGGGLGLELEKEKVLKRKRRGPPSGFPQTWGTPRDFAENVPHSGGGGKKLVPFSFFVFPRKSGRKFFLETDRGEGGGRGGSLCRRLGGGGPGAIFSPFSVVRFAPKGWGGNGARNFFLRQIFSTPLVL